MGGDLQEILKAVANPLRMQMLTWLADPKRNFGKQDVGDFDQDGVCVSLIQKKCGLSQSTTSQYLALLHRAGLVKTKRLGPWTYYRRDEVAIRKFLGDLGASISGPASGAIKQSKAG